MNTKIRAGFNLFAAVLCVFFVGALPQAASAAVSNQSLAVPIFQQPSKGTMWSDITAATSSSVPFVVANQNNGPGTAPDATLTAAISKANAAGIRTLGYVQINYDARNFKLAYNDINAWYQMYPGIRGVYVDLVQEGAPGDVCYAAALYSHVKNVHPADLVVLNPSTNISQDYEPYGDIFVNADTDYGTYQTWQPQYKGFEDNINYQNRFWHIIYGVNQQNYSSAFSQARTNNAGWVFITDQSQPSPFSVTPTYWQSEASDVNAIPSSTIPNRGLTTLPRGCISLSSSASNSIDTTTPKQTTVTSAITVNNIDTTYDSEPTTKLQFTSVPKGAAVTALAGSNWTCSSSQACTYGAPLSAGSSQSLSATVQATCTYGGGNATLRLTNYAGNRWDLSIPVRPPVGCDASTPAAKAAGGATGQTTTVTTQSVETTPGITPLNGTITVLKKTTKAATKKSTPFIRIAAIAVIVVDLLSVAAWGGWTLYQNRNPYKIK